MGDLFNTLNKSVPGRSSMPLEGQFLCCALSVLAIALYKNFPQNVLVSSSFWSPRKRRHGLCMYEPISLSLFVAASAMAVTKKLLGGRQRVAHAEQKTKRQRRIPEKTNTRYSIKTVKNRVQVYLYRMWDAGKIKTSCEEKASQQGLNGLFRRPCSSVWTISTKVANIFWKLNSHLAWRTESVRGRRRLQASTVGHLCAGCC